MPRRPGPRARGRCRHGPVSRTRAVAGDAVAGDAVEPRRPCLRARAPVPPETRLSSPSTDSEPRTRIWRPQSASGVGGAVAAGIAGTGAGAGVGIGWLTGRGHDAQRVGAVADGRVRGRMSGAGEYARARADDGGRRWIVR
jgi:hypothetical protein